MAKYQIAAINYIASGDQRTLLNIDTQLVYHNVKNVYILDSEDVQLCNIVTEEGDIDYLPTEYIDKEHPFDRRRLQLSSQYKLSAEPLSEEGLSNSIILNEQQKYGYDRHIGKNKRIMLYLSSDVKDYEAALQSFSDDIYQENRTFVAENAGSEPDDLVENIHLGRTIRPIYDIRDVTIKTCILKEALNSNLYQTDEFFDIYAPAMSAYPLGFCQAAGDAYMATDVTQDNPYMLYSSLNADRLNYDKQRDFYYMQISASRAGEYLYAAKDDIGTSSYADMPYSELFSPVRELFGLQHNYILQINTQQYPSKYEKGDIYAQQIDLAKNMYDSLYSMNMPDQTTIQDCRRYCGIGQFNDNVYLKFYDNAGYSQVSARDDAASGIKEMETRDDAKKKYPFQKIEMYLPNSFKTSSTHKSNLFSVKIKNKCIGRLDTDESPDRDEETSRRLYQTLKRDIKNACMRIAEQAAPVNTQFFDVFFEQ